MKEEGKDTIAQELLLGDFIAKRLLPIYHLKQNHASRPYVHLFIYELKGQHLRDVHKRCNKQDNMN